MTRRLVLSLVAACALFVAADVPRASAEGWAYEMADELLSPFCPGRTLADCPSPQAKTLVTWLSIQEGAGRSRAEVEVELVERYGESILPAPPPRGFALTAYLFPFFAFLVGGSVVWWFLRRQTREATEPIDQQSTGPLDPELEAIVDRDLGS